MIESTPPKFSESNPELFETVLRTTITIAAIAAPTIDLLIFYYLHRADEISLRYILVAALPLLFVLLWLFQYRIERRKCGQIFVSLMLVLSFASFLVAGISPLPVALQLLTLIIAGLLFGATGVYLVLAINLLSITLTGFAVVNGLVPAMNASLLNPLLSGVWVRAGIVLTVFGAISAIAVTYTVSQLQQESENLRQSLLRETDQRLRLQQAEAEKELARKALSDAQRVEALGRLASGIAHDFNNSLTVITGFAEMAEREPGLPQHARSALETIKNAALDAADMTQGLLTLGRVDPTQSVVINTGDLLEEMYASTSRLLPEDITFTLKEKSAGQVLVNRNQLERVLLNLVINARDSLGDGGEISLGCHDIEITESVPTRPAGNYVVIWVQDTGSGIDDEVMAHIFEPFFTTKERGSGTGMGMALAKSFSVEASGDIEIDSTPGKGTKVSLYLPKISEDSVLPAVEPEAKDFQITGSDYTILVVEDDPGVLAALTAIFQSAEFNVLVAENGDDALEIIRANNQHFDVMCIDGVIPGASSAEVIDCVREKHPGKGIVVCSGYVEEELVRRGIQTGDLAYVKKPYQSVELLDRIQSQLNAG